MTRYRGYWVVALMVSLGGCGQPPRQTGSKSITIADAKQYIELPNIEVPEDELPELPDPDTKTKLEVPADTAGGCIASLPRDKEGHERRCCLIDTPPEYFLDQETGKPRHCAEGEWVKSETSCAFGSKKDKATIWRCSVEAPEPVTPPAPPPVSKDPTLSEVAEHLASLSEKDYSKLQVKYLGTSYPACNYFLITALCEAGFCKQGKPLYGASQFDTYLLGKNWVEVSYEEMRELVAHGKGANIVGQRDPIPPQKHGHVLIPVGIDAKTGRTIVAEGSLGESTHRFRSVSSVYFKTFKGGMKLFMRR